MHGFQSNIDSLSVTAAHWRIAPKRQPSAGAGVKALVGISQSLSIALSTGRPPKELPWNKTGTFTAETGDPEKILDPSSDGGCKLQ